MIESYGEYFTESGVVYMERIQKMQIALTKKLSDALCIKSEERIEDINPIFTWTANWTNIWTNRKTEDMLVLVNNATRFVVAVYQVKKKDLKNIEKNHN